MNNLKDFIPNKKNQGELELFTAYFKKALINKDNKIDQALIDKISEFLTLGNFNERSVGSFLQTIRKEDNRLFNNYKRAFRRTDRIKRIRVPGKFYPVGAELPEDLYKRFKKYAKDNKTTMKHLIEKLIKKELN